MTPRYVCAADHMVFDHLNTASDQKLEPEKDGEHARLGRPWFLEANFKLIHSLQFTLSKHAFYLHMHQISLLAFRAAMAYTITILTSQPKKYLGKNYASYVMNNVQWLPAHPGPISKM